LQRRPHVQFLLPQQRKMLTLPVFANAQHGLHTAKIEE